MNDSAEPELTLEAAQQVLAAQPFSVLIGVRMASFPRGEGILDIDVRSELLQQNGFVHGGVLSYAADNALTFVGGSVLAPRYSPEASRSPMFAPGVDAACGPTPRC